MLVAIVVVLVVISILEAFLSGPSSDPRNELNEEEQFFKEMLISEMLDDDNL